jgi:hypothetical protein
MRDVTRIAEIVETLETEGYDVTTTYSGRCMYGRRCLGVTVDHSGHIFQLGQLLHEYDEMGEPRTDSMGLSVIVYWPAIDTADYNDHVKEEDDEEDLEDA